MLLLNVSSIANAERRARSLSFCPHFKLNRKGRTISDLIGMEMNGPKYDRMWFDGIRSNPKKFSDYPGEWERRDIRTVGFVLWCSVG